MGIIMPKPIDSLAVSGPPMRTPLTDCFGSINMFDGTECEGFELRFLDCAEAYGHKMSQEKCKFLFQDFVECARKRKQLARIDEMKLERKKQWLRGQLGTGPKVPLNNPDRAPQDGYAPDPWDHKGPYF